MGKDKAFLCVGSETLLARALRLAATITETVCIVGDPDKFCAFRHPVISDLYRERGPLGGIHAALSATNSDLNLVLAVDMPLINSNLLSFLIEKSRQSAATVTIPNAGGGFQPLCAVYRKQFREIAEESLRAGENKIDPLFRKGICRIVTEDELAQAGFSPEVFRNLNTPEDLEFTRLACREK